MSDPVAPAAPAAPPPDAAAPAAPVAPAVPAAKPAPRHPYGAKAAQRPVAPAQAAPEAKPADAQAQPEAKPASSGKGSKLVSVRDRQIAELKGKVEPLEEQQKRYARAIGPLVERELEGLPEKARARLAKKYAGDPLALLDYLEEARAMDAFVRPSAKPATTAPAAAPPAVAPSDPDAQVLADYAKLKASGSSARLAVFMQQHGAALARAQARSKGASNN